MREKCGSGLAIATAWAATGVIADLIRNPVVAQRWIPDQVRDDNCGVREDNRSVIAGSDPQSRESGKPGG